MPSALSSSSRWNVGLNPGIVAPAFRLTQYQAVLRSAARDDSPDVIVTNSTKAHIVGAASFPGLAPQIAYVRDRLDSDYMSRTGVRLARGVLRTGPQAIIANSAATLATVPNSRRQRFRAVLPSPISNPQALVARPGEPATTDGGLRFGMVGRLAHWKGQHLAIRAFARVFGGSQTTLEILGDALFDEAGYEVEVRALIQELGLSSQVHLRGHVRDVYPSMATWHGLVHASISPEPFGQVIAQGMAMGLPVLASGEGGPAETIRSGIDGLLFRPRDEGDLASAWRTLADDPALRASLGAEARRVAVRFFPDTLSDEFEGLLDALRAEGPPISGPPRAPARLS